MIYLLAICFIVGIGISYTRSRSSTTKGGAPTVPSLLPWIGNTIQYTKDPAKFMNECRERYGSVFKMVLGGKSFTVVSDARGLDSIFRDRHRAFNVHPAHLRIAKAVGGVKRADEVVHIISDRLFPLVTRELGREGMNKFIPSFNADLLSLVEAMAARVRNSSHGAPIPLMPFIGKSLYHAINMAAYGPLYPFESYDDFEVCDFDLILLLSRIPFLSRRVVQSQQRIIRSLGDYIDRAWSGGQLEGASVLTSEVVSILKDSNLDDPDVAGAVFTFTWGMLSNPIRITYWLMVFILNDAMATTRIREEVDRELRDHFGGDLKQMLAAPFTDVETRFPLLESAVHETMRMGILQTALREAHADTEIYTNSGMMQVQKGDLLMTNIYPVHMDPETFSDPETFRPDRFLDEKTRAHMGFGGGRHLCKGKLFALHVVKMLVILCFGMFDMELVDASGKSAVGNIPPADPRRSVSVLRPCSGQTLYAHAKMRDLKG